MARRKSVVRFDKNWVSVSQHGGEFRRRLRYSLWAFVFAGVLTALAAVAREQRADRLYPYPDPISASPVFSERQQFELRQAVVTVNGCCTGVIVTPDGLVLTAKHCEIEETATIGFPDGKKLPAKRLWVSERSEGAVALKLEGGSFPFSEVGPVPQKGARVFTIGYPTGRYAYLEGELLGAGDVDGVRLNVTNFRVSPGHSGGPLFDEKGRVIGLASAASVDVATPSGVERSEQRSYWIPASECGRAIAASGNYYHAPPPRQRNTLLAFKTTWCAPCQQFEKDYADNRDGLRDALDGTYDVEFHDPDKKPDLAQQHGIAGVPTFLVPATNLRVAGYTSPLALIEQLHASPAQYEPIGGGGGPPVDPGKAERIGKGLDLLVMVLTAAAGAIPGLGWAARLVWIIRAVRQVLPIAAKLREHLSDDEKTIVDRARLVARW